jgi:ubiquinone biosynthesis protein
MCEDMCGQYTGGDFGDFELGDLLGTVISNLQEESYKIDPFLTNLARGIVAVEGTVKALSPRVNILNYFIDKVDTGAGFGVDLDNISTDTLTELTGPLAIELLKFLNNTSKSTAKTAETLDMLEKGQIRLHSDFDFGQKATDSLFDIVKFAVEGLMVIALFVGSCLLCTVSPNAMESSATLRVVFPEMGFVGYLLSVLLAFMLFRSVKKRE